MHHLTIEYDCKELTKLMNSNDGYYQNLVDDCRGLLQEMEDPPLKHIFREANKVADKLAKKGSSSDVFGDLNLFYYPATFVVSSFERDKAGTMSPRLVHVCNDV
ncbi:hypothetical protein A4A49_61144 [Nicotiana attenuata]|uniref:RNase H type-1 domain-containing protein n=1 Tax=Nicotiana attenuata TaxID=49451 RepID=A0A314LFX7_NICAT|nr:hypothetical protein A4A49_61144 [Nicotiana attenuata]